MTAAEFLDWVETLSGENRYELAAGKPEEMAAENNRHDLVKTACCRVPEDKVRERKLACVVLGNGARVVVSDDDVYEPDAVVQCGEDIALDVVNVPSPMILVEVRSRSTRGLDAGGKLFGRAPERSWSSAADGSGRCLRSHSAGDGSQCPKPAQGHTDGQHRTGFRHGLADSAAR